MIEQEKFFKTADNTELFYRYRPAKKGGSNNKAIILFHRGHEHSGRIMFVADEIGFDDFAYFAWDARGHGKSPGKRGDSPSFGTAVSDIQSFFQHIEQIYHIVPENICVIAQSISAVLVSTWLHDYAPKIRCAILAAPAFKVKLYVPFARIGLTLWSKLRGNFFVNSYVKAKYLTHNQERQESFNRDPLITRAISVRMLLGLYKTAERVVLDAQAITTPIQLFISGDDWVVDNKPQHDFYNHLGSYIKERHILDGFLHDTFGEENNYLVFEPMKRFIRERFDEPLQIVDRTCAHIFGTSRLEADKLSTPLPPYSLEGLFWASYRALMKLGARWSEGLRIGQVMGYDSGSMLDYVYRNQPQGTNVFGRLVDKHYLNAIGWRGIRQRKENIAKAIRLAICKLREVDKAIHILDIASGHGRYVLDALTAENWPDSLRLRDYSPVNVMAGLTLIKERGLPGTVTFNEINAFESTYYEDLSPRPTLGIVSGLYELFTDNDLIMCSLNGLGSTIEQGGYLIYTGQPWHPQLELIARCLTSHKEGKPNWVMRRRSQQEIDQLVEKAGFRKIHQWIDEDGIFTVSLAIKK